MSRIEQSAALAADLDAFYRAYDRHGYDDTVGPDPEHREENVRNIDRLIRNGVVKKQITELQEMGEMSPEHREEADGLINRLTAFRRPPVEERDRYQARAEALAKDLDTFFIEFDHFESMTTVGLYREARGAYQKALLKDILAGDVDSKITYLMRIKDQLPESENRVNPLIERLCEFEDSNRRLTERPEKLERLPVSGAPCYKLLEFNDAILAYRLITQPVVELQYITWQRDLDSQELIWGHYFTSDNDALNEQQAMRDFVVRSGLIRECDLLANKDLPALAGTVNRLLDSVDAREDEINLEKLAAQIARIQHEPKEMYLDKEGLLEVHGIDKKEQQEIPDAGLDLDEGEEENEK